MSQGLYPHCNKVSQGIEQIKRVNGLVLYFVLPFGPETSGSKEDSVSKERLCLKD